MLHPCWCQSSWILGSIFCKPLIFQSIPQIYPYFLKDLTLSYFLLECVCTLDNQIFWDGWILVSCGKDFFRCLVLEYSVWSMVLYIHRCSSSFCPHRCIGRSWSWSISFDASIIVLLFLSITPFCCGLYGVVKSLLIPESLHNYLNSSNVNSPPLSDWKVLIFFSV